MRLFAFISSIFAGLYLLCASDVTDLHPPWDAIKLVSFNRGDATDRSWLAQTPTVSAGATFPAGYRVADFDGTSNAVISYPSDSAFESAAITVCFWLRIDGLTSRVNLVGRSTVTAAPELYRGWYVHYIGASAGANGLTFATNKNASNWAGVWTGLPAVFNDGAWRHIACTRDSISSTTNWKIYVNGASFSLTTGGAGTSDDVTPTSEPLKIGGQTTLNQTGYMNGALDDVRIYSTVKTAAEIAAIYAEGIGASRP